MYQQLLTECCAALAGTNNAAISQSGEAVGAGFYNSKGKPFIAQEPIIISYLHMVL